MLKNFMCALVLCFSTGTVFANYCGDGGQYGSDPGGSGQMGCYGGSMGNRPYGTHPRDGLGPLPPDTSGSNSGGGSQNTPSFPPSPPVVVNRYGAVALSSNNAYGYAFNQSSQSDAEAEAMDMCYEDGCKILGTFANTCAAVGFGLKPRGGSYIVLRTNTNLTLAKSKALRECSKQARNCQIAVADCSVYR